MSHSLTFFDFIQRYTLQGMRINPQNGLKPGLYVKSGRKVLVR